MNIKKKYLNKLNVFFRFPMWKILLLSVIYSIICSFVYFINNKNMNLNIIGGTLVISLFLLFVLRYLIEFNRIPLFIIADIKKDPDYEERAFNNTKISGSISVICFHVIILVLIILNKLNIFD